MPTREELDRVLLHGTPEETVAFFAGRTERERALCRDRVLLWFVCLCRWRMPEVYDENGGDYDTDHQAFLERAQRYAQWERER